jgi:hypothetical protein
MKKLLKKPAFLAVSIAPRYPYRWLYQQSMVITSCDRICGLAVVPIVTVLIITPFPLEEYLFNEPPSLPEASANAQRLRKEKTRSYTKEEEKEDR